MCKPFKVVIAGKVAESFGSYPAAKKYAEKKGGVVRRVYTGKK